MRRCHDKRNTRNNNCLGPGLRIHNASDCRSCLDRSSNCQVLPPACSIQREGGRATKGLRTVLQPGLYWLCEAKFRIFRMKNIKIPEKSITAVRCCGTEDSSAKCRCGDARKGRYERALRWGPLLMCNGDQLSLIDLQFTVSVVPCPCCSRLVFHLSSSNRLSR